MSGLRFRPSIGFRGNFVYFRLNQYYFFKINNLKRDRILSICCFIHIKQKVKVKYEDLGGKMAAANVFGHNRLYLGFPNNLMDYML